MSSFAERAQRRAQRITLDKTRHGAREASSVDREEAIALVSTLSRASHALAGLPWPSYTRKQIPVKFVRR